MATAEETAAGVRFNATQQLASAQAAERQSQSASATASQVSQEVADAASIAALQGEPSWITKNPSIMTIVVT